MNILTRIRNKVKRETIKVFGPKRYCNVCNTHFKGAFTPLPSIYMEEAKRTGYPHVVDEAETINYKEYSCPNCNSSDRDRLYALYLSKRINPTDNYQVLDIAPADALRKFLKNIPFVTYRCADLFMEGVDDKVDLMDMHIYENERFDIFICSHILEHVPDDRKAMKELYRVLKQDGFGIAMVPIILTIDKIDEDPTITNPDERYRRFGQDDHVRLYSKNGFLQRLKETGFKVEEVTVKDFDVNTFQLHGISPKSVLYIVTK